MTRWVCPDCGGNPRECSCDMKIPAGETCGTCAHWKRCKGLIMSLDYYAEMCDFAPSRFVPVAAESSRKV